MTDHLLFEHAKLLNEIMSLVEDYGDERAVESYHGKRHCRQSPEDLLEQIRRTVTEVIVK